MFFGNTQVKLRVSPSVEELMCDNTVRSIDGMTEIE